MKFFRPINILVLHLVILFWLSSCNHGTQDNGSDLQRSEKLNVLIEAESYNDSEGIFKEIKNNNGDYLVHSEKDGWLAFEVEIPVAGRYVTQISVNPSSDSNLEFWIEDYYNNPDGRTYNITGKMTTAEEDNNGANNLQTLSVDGSPLNKGMHQMKLHIGPGKADIDWIQFILLKEHKETPKTLTQSTTGEDWKIIWSDEFESEGDLDTTKWLYDIGNWGWGNSELQYYTENRRENARLEDGCLIIEAHKNDMDQLWTSARLTTRGKVSFLYGKIEFRAKVPRNRGNWAAGWTLGDSYIDELSWPYCGEIDILESVGFEMNDETGDGIAHASIHCGAYYFKLNNQPTSILDVSNMEEEFHTYAVEWYPDEIKAFVDGNHYLTYNDTTTNLAWPFDKPQDIILNLAMGGGWGGAQGMDETITSQKFIIDYVRVYELQ